ncbi:MAG: hypothetical protein NTX28_06050 [Novosphingobium sp.]|nr:hypothetical protein [Novosphingobium sp.]
MSKTVLLDGKQLAHKASDTPLAITPVKQTGHGVALAIYSVNIIALHQARKMWSTTPLQRSVGPAEHVSAMLHQLTTARGSPACHF